MSKFIDYLATLPQYLLPHHFLSRIMLFITRIRFIAFKNFFIETFIQLFDVDMDLAKRSQPEEFVHFNDFFTRSLKPEARPIEGDEKSLVSPVDGTISQIGSINDELVFQAKGHHYTLTALLGGDATLASQFINGKFTTIYLSPRDYHRIHMPVTGKLKTMLHVPGRLFSVNGRTTRMVPNLFARNERVVSIFDTEHGPMALIMVGAIFVGSMETVWSGTVTPTSSRKKVTSWHYGENGDIQLERGQEMGRFNMGSTVILLFPQQSIEWSDIRKPDDVIKMGQQLAHISHQGQNDRAKI